MTTAAMPQTDAGGGARKSRHGQASVALDPDLVEAVDVAATIRETRDRARAEIPMPDRMSGLLTGCSFVGAVALWLVLFPPPVVPVAVLLLCIVAHGAAASIEFEIGPGVALPTTPVLFVSLFLLAPQLVPVVAATGLLIGAVVHRLQDPTRRERLSVLAGSAWHSVGPALVFSIAGAGPANLRDLNIYAVALFAQYAFDGASSWVRNCYGLHVPVRKVAEALRFAWLADLLLAPIGLATALAIPRNGASLLFLVGPIVLLAWLQQDRERHIDRAVVLSEAFTLSADRARRDALTGLRNRLAWEEAISQHAEKPGPVGVVLADVDGLKATNDAIGHDAGDRLLIAVADLIASVAPDNAAMVARLGGDEFGILLPGHLAGDAARVADRLRAALAIRRTAEGGALISASVGHGVARAGSMLSFAFIEADRGVYEEKARRSGSRR